MRPMLLLVVLAMLAGCPAGTQKMSPYDIARTVLSYHPTGLAVADAIVNRWASKQTDETKKKEVLDRYEKIKKAIDEGVAAALKSIDVAEEAGKPIDQRQLQDRIRELVQEALDFALALEGAISSTPAGVPAETPAAAPSPAKTPTV